MTEERGYIPESWLLDLYSAGNYARSMHTTNKYAVQEIESWLVDISNLPSVLAPAVAQDIVNELVCKKNQCTENVI